MTAEQRAEFEALLDGYWAWAVAQVAEPDAFRERLAKARAALTAFVERVAA